MKSKHSRRIVPISLSQYALACGARTGVRKTFTPRLSVVSSTSVEKMLSRS